MKHVQVRVIKDNQNDSFSIQYKTGLFWKELDYDTHIGIIQSDTTIFNTFNSQQKAIAQAKIFQNHIYECLNKKNNKEVVWTNDTYRDEDLT
jgi:hypothetical protein